MSGPTGITLNAGSGGASLGVDSDGTYDYEIVKLGVSVAGSTPVQVSSGNPLPVNVVAGGGTGGTSLADGSTFTRGTTAETPIGGVVDGSTPSLTAGKAAALSLNTDGSLNTHIVNGLQPAQTRYSATATNTAVLVNGAACTLYGLDVYSPSANSGDVFLQIFDAAAADDVTLGATAPTMSIGMAGAGGGTDRSWAAGVAFANGIVVAATTTRAGETAPSNALAVNMELT